MGNLKGGAHTMGIMLQTACEYYNWLNNMLNVREDAIAQDIKCDCDALACALAPKNWATPSDYGNKHMRTLWS
ncbi:MAG: hypothetical protein ACKPKO_37970, partial [Candidatus Fonsibacter sp.]